MTKEDLVGDLYERGLIPAFEQVILSDGFEDAIIGITSCLPRRAVYDFWKCIDVILKADTDVTFDEALEWMESYVQEPRENTEPIFIKKV